jgi:hypothetical protein
MPFLIALAIGLASGAHTATWGMYKDSPHEGFTWPKYFRSILLSAFLALAWQAGTGLDLAQASARVVLFGLTYVSERGIVELYKTYLREEDQSKYTIPMQFHVFGHLVASRAVRWSVAAGWVAAVALVLFGLRSLEGADEALTPLLAVLLVGSIGGWMSAFGGAFKDAPIEGFETLKFFRSPLIALIWSLLLACFTHDLVFIVFGALGYTVATIETYKTFFFPNKPRGKFAGKELRFPEMLGFRRAFVPLYAAVWTALLLNLALAWGEPRRGFLGAPVAGAMAEVTPAPGRYGP